MLNKTTIAQLLNIAAEAFSKAACLITSEVQGAPSTSDNLSGSTEAQVVAATKPRRGRPPGSTNAALPVTETPAEPEPHPTKPEPPAKPEGSKTLDELRALIKPLILATRGEEVKAVLNKFAPKDHSGDYTLSLLSERPETHAEFVKEIEALLI